MHPPSSSPPTSPSPSTPSPLSTPAADTAGGVMLARESRLTVRVRYVECDPMGFLHHSHYLPFFEMGRTELLRLSGISYKELEDRDVLFAVTKVAVSFKRPARYDDQLELVTRIVKQTHVRIDHAYQLYNTTTRELLCTAESTIACINKKGEVQAIPDFLGGKYASA